MQWYSLLNKLAVCFILSKNRVIIQVKYSYLHVIFIFYYRYKNSIVKPSDNLIINQGGQYDYDVIFSFYFSTQHSVYAAVDTPTLVEIFAWLDIAGSSRPSLFTRSMQRDKPRKTGRDCCRQLLKKYRLICQSTDLTLN